MEIEQRRREMELETGSGNPSCTLTNWRAQSRLEMSELEHAVNLQSRRREERHLQDLERERQRLDLSRERIRSQGSDYCQGFGYRRGRCQRSPALCSSSLPSRNSPRPVTPKSRPGQRPRRRGIPWRFAREEQDRERSHQAEMTGLASHMMEASKQNPTLLTPGQSPSRVPPTEPSINVTNVSAPAPVAPASSCPSCKAAVQGGAKFCPHCGTSLALNPQCPGCRSPVEPAWKHCPNCGNFN